MWMKRAVLKNRVKSVMAPVRVRMLLKMPIFGGLVTRWG